MVRKNANPNAVGLVAVYSHYLYGPVRVRVGDRLYAKALEGNGWVLSDVFSYRGDA